METTRVNLTALAVALIAGLVILHESQSIVASLAGLALLVALFAFGQDNSRTGGQSFAFAMVCGLAVLSRGSSLMATILSSLVCRAL